MEGAGRPIPGVPSSPVHQARFYEVFRLRSVVLLLARLSSVRGHYLALCVDSSPRRFFIMYISKATPPTTKQTKGIAIISPVETLEPISCDADWVRGNIEGLGI